MKIKIFNLLFALLLVASFSLVTAVPMATPAQAATLYESYNTGDDDARDFSGTTWRAQTFTPSAHTITSVKLKLYRTGSPGTITVSIRATDGTHPTGLDLCSNTTTGNDLPALSTKTRLPTSDRGWLGTWDTTTNMYTYVDDDPWNDGDTTRLLHGTAMAGYVLFNFSAFDVPAGSIIESLDITYACKDDSSGSNNLRAALRVNGSNYLTTDSGANPGGSYADRTYSFTTNPDTPGVGWTVDDINGTGANPLQAFGTNSTDATPAIRITAVKAVVNYIPTEWREITLGAGASLSASTKYAIVVRATGGDGSNYVNWRYDSTTSAYAGGCRERSSSSGSDGSWTSTTPDDFMFEEWGAVAVVAPTVTTSAASNVEETTATLNGNVTDTGGENPTVTVYWGDNDGGQGAWDYNSAPTSPGQPQGVAAFYKDATGLSPGTLYYFSAKATNTGGTGWGTTRSFTTKPEAPTDFTATPDSYQIELSWTMGTGAAQTVIRSGIGSDNYPAAPDAGDDVYFGTGDSYPNTGLLPNTTYCYSAWSWVEGTDVWSDTYAEATATTAALVPTYITITQQPAGEEPDTVLNPLSTQPIVNVDDQNEDNMAGVTVTALISTGTGALRNDTAVTDGDGNATFTVLGYCKSGEVFSIYFTAGGAESAESDEIGPLSPGEATYYTVVTQHSGTETAGTAFSVTVTAKDAYDNTVNSGPNNYTDDYSVDWISTATNSPNDTPPTLPDYGIQTFTDGVATVGGFTLTNAGETPTITATTGIGTVEGTSDKITVNPGAAASLAISPDEETITAGASEEYTALATDGYGNTFDATADTGWGIDDAAGGTWGEDGYPGVNNNYTSQFAGIWTVMGTYDTTELIDEVRLTVNHGDLNHYTVIPIPHSEYTAGTPFDVEITAVDKLNNPLGEDYEPVPAPPDYYTWTTNASDAPDTTSPEIGTLAGTDFVNGTATKSVTLYCAEGGVTFFVQDDNDVTGTSDPIDVTPGAAVGLDVTPDDAEIYAYESQAYTATAYDDFDNPFDVTEDTAFTITEEAGGSWLDNVYTSEVVGEWWVTGTYDSLTDDAYLAVYPWQGPVFNITQRTFWPTIQLAIDNVNLVVPPGQPGDTILVSPLGSPYAESLTILDKSLTLRSTGGAEATTIVGGGGDTIVTINLADGGEGQFVVVFDGFTATNAPLLIKLVTVDKESSVTIKNCVLYNCVAGILSEGASIDSGTVNIAGNEIRECDMAGIGFALVRGGSAVTIQNNNIYHAQRGISFNSISSDSPVTRVAIRSNAIHDTWEGIVLESVDSTSIVTITGNTITNNFSPGSGIDLLEDVNVTNVRVNFNNIFGNGPEEGPFWGVWNNAPGLLNAKNNWWGNPNGPGADAFNTYPVGDNVLGAVNFTPWLRVPVTGATSGIAGGGKMLDAKGVADTEVDVSPGTATVTVAKYSGNPGTGTFGGDIGKYVDVQVTGATIPGAQVEIRIYYTAADLGTLDETTLRLRWWDGDSWEGILPSENSGVDNNDIGVYLGYMWARINDTIPTTPSLTDLGGTAFGGSGGAAGAGPGAGGGGGGGGGGLVKPTLKGLVATPEVRLDPEGKIQIRCVVQTTDGKLTLDIAKGTRLLDTLRRALTTLSAALKPSPPAPPSGAAIILAYDFGPNGAVFLPAIRMSMEYDPATFSEDVAEQGLYIAYWDGSKWVALKTTVDTMKRTASCEVSHLTTFALIGAVTPPAPAAFSVSSLSVSPLKVKPEEAVAITISVANTGGTEGSYSVALKVNGVMEAEESVTVAPGSSQSVSFSVTREEAGSYSVDVNGLSGSFTVAAAEAAPGAKLPISWMWIWIIAGVVVVGLIIFFLVRRMAH